MPITTVKILKNLPLAIASTRAIVCKYKTSRAFKVFETFAYLKTITTSGKIHNQFEHYDDFVSYMANICGVSRNTMYTRIQWLKDFNLITIQTKIKSDHVKSITLESWDTVAITYGIKPNQFYEITIIETSSKLEYILKTYVIAEIQSRLTYKFSQFVSNNHLKVRLEQLLGKWATIQELSEKIMLMQRSSFKTWSDSYDFWHSLRADFNCNIDTLAKYFHFDDHRSSCYLKKVLTKLSLIKVQARKTESKKATRKPKSIFSGNTINLNLIWDEVKKIRVWQQPDKIIVTL